MDYYVSCIIQNETTGAFIVKGIRSLPASRMNLDVGFFPHLVIDVIAHNKPSTAPFRNKVELHPH